MKKKLLIVISIIIFLLGIWSVIIEPNMLVINRQTMVIKNWPENLELKIAIISDLHIGLPPIGEEKLEEVVKKTNALNPDIVIFLGDFDSYYITRSGIKPEVISSIFKNLKTSYGIYAIFGNHDRSSKVYRPFWGFNKSTCKKGLVKNILKESNIILLEDTYESLLINNKRIWLIGFSDGHYSEVKITEFLSKIPENEPKVLLNHRPDVFKKLPEGINLTLAGHTHGGQVSLPVIGAPLPHSKYGYVKGKFKEGNKQLFVTSGIGNIFLPIRLGNKPEIVLLTLKN